MSISHINQLKSSSLDLGQHLDQGLLRGPSQSDVDLFNAAMRPDMAAQSSHLSEQIASALSERLGSTDKLSQLAIRNMKKAASGDNPMDITHMSRTLSQYSLQTAVTTKVVNKSAQALDKLTNLQ
ncbi:type III secretion system inner rod subunit SctI [Pseudomonas sp. FP1740]|uniref:type III secretion system inner rod subunit SctI n=1 Tax=Pseudomonas sp. FP1740 TaxID=2954078 RepID=UPI002733CEE1|nr:type III secretion system inner rod subunit SctI [Pseudomonas sp. FP1740]WLG46816.1 type III secretion system inner rod subunit SctI [Pseudomonas sp. FP1740]